VLIKVFELLYCLVLKWNEEALFTFLHLGLVLELDVMVIFFDGGMLL
jgi:hypothetical protein